MTLVERLKSRTGVFLNGPNAMKGAFKDRDCQEAAALIEHLQRENAEIKDLLREADRKLAWESIGFGNDFADRVENACRVATKNEGS